MASYVKGFSDISFQISQLNAYKKAGIGIILVDHRVVDPPNKNIFDRASRVSAAKRKVKVLSRLTLVKN